MLPKDHKERLIFSKERIEYWLSVGAQPTEKVAKFFIALGIKGAEKYAPTFVPKEKGDGLKKKALEKLEKEKEAAAAGRSLRPRPRRDRRRRHVAAAQNGRG